MARPIDPTPRRVVPPHEKASEIAHVATSMEELTRLLTDKPPAWTLAAFISVLVQRRNALQGRLRTVSAGYQPDPWEMPISAQEYYALAHSAMVRIANFGSQTEKFLASPAFTGAVGRRRGSLAGFLRIGAGVVLRRQLLLVEHQAAQGRLGDLGRQGLGARACRRGAAGFRRAHGLSRLA